MKAWNRARSSALPWVAYAVAVVFIVVQLILQIVNRTAIGAAAAAALGDSGAIFNTLYAIPLLIFPTVGVMIARRHPQNPIGWLFLGSGIMWGISGFSLEYAAHSIYVDPGSLPGAEIAAWLSTWMFLPPLLWMPPLLFILFPTGHVSGRISRAVVWLTGVSLLGFLISVFRPGPLEEPPFEHVMNPVGIDGAFQLLDTMAGLGWLVVLVAITVAPLVMLVRLRRSSGVERQQLKWLTTAAGLFLIVLVAEIIAVNAGLPELTGQLIILTAYAMIPIATGYAVLRHRLYDIDVVINRSLVYGSLTGVLAATYLGLVVLLQQVMNPFSENSDLAIATSTLVVAALVRPARRRIQASVDQRFYRRKYDAQQTLEAFADRLRKEIDSDTLALEIQTLVTRTMQPSQVGMWLKADRPG